MLLLHVRNRNIEIYTNYEVIYNYTFENCNTKNKRSARLASVMQSNMPSTQHSTKLIKSVFCDLQNKKILISKLNSTVCLIGPDQCDNKYTSPSRVDSPLSTLQYTMELNRKNK